MYLVSSPCSVYHSRMVDEDACKQGLVLGNGSDGKFSMGTICDLPRKEEVKLHILFPIDSEKMGEEHDFGRSSSRNSDQDEKDCDHDSREVCGDERRHAKKTMRLTTEQATLLENSFEEHRSLNYVQKQELADQLNLQPRQVEVWFQNRRARTKLKRTEMDCKYLKKYCQSLRVENQSLKEELITMKQHGSAPFSIHRLQRVPTNTSNICLSCQEISTSHFGRNNSNTFAKAS